MQLGSLLNPPIKKREIKNCTFIGLGAEDRAEFDMLVAGGEQHIFFTDRVNIPDIKVIPGTSKIYQIQGDLEEPGVIDTNHSFNLYTVILPCSCPNCRSDPSNINGCLYKNNHNVTKVVVSKLIDSNQEMDDPYNLLQLTVTFLKTQLQAKGLPTNGDNPELRARLLQYLEDCDME